MKTILFLRPILLLSLCLITLRCTSSNIKSTPDELTAHDQKIDSIISVMTLEEKVNMLCGNGLFTSAGIERLGIGEIHYTDGPFGIREELGKKSWGSIGLTTDSATFFPTGSALAASWNPDLAWQYGETIGAEAKTRGKDILLGPAINITRTPLNGRTFEYMSEDPYLNSRLAVAYSLELHASDLSWFDEKQMKWVLAPRKYRLSAGSSSRAIRGSVDININ